jgi:hypothetical protein
MAIKHVELKTSRAGTDTTDRTDDAQLVYSVWGSSDVDELRNHIKAYVPAYYNNLIYDKLGWQHLGGDVWEFTAFYKHPDESDEEQRDNLQTGEYVFSFDTSGGSTKRMVSLATTKYAKTGETAPEFRGAIGVERDGGEIKVEGVEIGIQALKFSIHKRMPRTTITTDYVKTLSQLTYTTNNAAFLGFAIGELLFVGASGSQGTNSDPEITFNFIASPNASALTVGEITGVSKKGHEYLWAFFEKIEDSSAKVTVAQPKAAYVEQVYSSSDFTLLGI